VILLSLVLVLLSLGLLIWGLAGVSVALVWASIVASLMAGGCLALAVLRRPRPVAESTLAEPAVVGVSTSAEIAAVSGSSGSAPAKAEVIAAGSVEPAAPAVSGVGAAEDTGEDTEIVALVDTAEPVEDYPDPPDEPAEEDVSAPTVLKVVDLDAEVVVVDGRPRYHLADCPHLAGRETVPLPVSEARESGFTPCSLCKPDATLTARAGKPAAAPAGSGAEKPATAESVDAGAETNDGAGATRD
jgi:hypothetical protein